MDSSAVATQTLAVGELGPRPFVWLDAVVVVAQGVLKAAFGLLGIRRHDPAAPRNHSGHESGPADRRPRLKPFERQPRALGLSDSQRRVDQLRRRQCHRRRERPRVGLLEMADRLAGVSQPELEQPEREVSLTDRPAETRRESALNRRGRVARGTPPRRRSATRSSLQRDVGDLVLLVVKLTLSSNPSAVTSAEASVRLAHSSLIASNGIVASSSVNEPADRCCATTRAKRSRAGMKSAIHMPSNPASLVTSGSVSTVSAISECPVEPLPRTTLRHLRATPSPRRASSP